MSPSQRKLTAEQVMAIRRREITLQQACHLFGVNERVVRLARDGDTYKDLPFPAPVRRLARGNQYMTIPQ